MKSYTIAYSDNIPMGAGITDTFTINLPGRRITLKNLIITRRLLTPGTGNLIPEESNTQQYFSLRIGDTGQIFTGSMAAGTGTTAPTRNGTYIELWKPGQYFCTWADFTNSIRFTYAAGNNGPVMVQHNIDFYIEVEDKIIYFNQ